MREIWVPDYPPSPQRNISEGLAPEVVTIQLNQEEINDDIVLAAKLARGEVHKLGRSDPGEDEPYAHDDEPPINPDPAKDFEARLDTMRKGSFAELQAILETYATDRANYDGVLRRDSVESDKLNQASGAAVTLSTVLAELEAMGWDLDVLVGDGPALHRSLAALGTPDGKLGTLSRSLPNPVEEFMLNLMRWWQLTTGADPTFWREATADEQKRGSAFMMGLDALIEYLPDQLRPNSSRGTSGVGEKKLRELFENAVEAAETLSTKATQALMATSWSFGGQIAPTAEAGYRFVAEICGAPSEYLEWVDLETGSNSESVDDLVAALVKASLTGPVQCLFTCPVAGPTLGGDCEEEPRLLPRGLWSMSRNMIPIELHTALPVLEMVTTALKDAAPPVRFKLLDPNQSTKPGLSTYLLICETRTIDR